MLAAFDGLVARAADRQVAENPVSDPGDASRDLRTAAAKHHIEVVMGTTEKLTGFSRRTPYIHRPAVRRASTTAGVSAAVAFA